MGGDFQFDPRLKRHHIYSLWQQQSSVCSVSKQGKHVLTKQNTINTMAFDSIKLKNDYFIFLLLMIMQSLLLLLVYLIQASWPSVLILSCFFYLVYAAKKNVGSLGPLPFSTFCDKAQRSLNIVGCSVSVQVRNRIL